MAVEGLQQTLTIQAGANLEGQQHKVVVVAGTIAASNTAAIGVLTSQPNSGQNGTVAAQGHMKGYAGAAISAGARIKVTTSGYLATVGSGDGSVGKALVAAASGDLFNFFGDFANAGDGI